MKTRYIVYIVGALILLVIGTLIGMAPGDTDVDMGEDRYLPDHITEITGTTLPRAIEEARMRGKSVVRITDKSENVVEVDITRDVSTTFRIDNPNNIDVIQVLEDHAVDLSKAYDIVVNDSVTEFTMNVVHHADIAEIMYEASVRIHMPGSTQNWTIDLID